MRLIFHSLQMHVRCWPCVALSHNYKHGQIAVRAFFCLWACASRPYPKQKTGYSLKAGLRSRWLSGVEAGGGIRFDSAQRTTPKLSQLKWEAKKPVGSMGGYLLRTALEVSIFKNHHTFWRNNIITTYQWLLLIGGANIHRSWFCSVYGNQPVFAVNRGGF